MSIDNNYRLLLRVFIIIAIGLYCVLSSIRQRELLERGLLLVSAADQIADRSPLLDFLPLPMQRGSSGPGRRE